MAQRTRMGPAYKPVSGIYRQSVGVKAKRLGSGRLTFTCPPTCKTSARVLGAILSRPA